MKYAGKGPVNDLFFAFSASSEIILIKSSAIRLFTQFSYGFDDKSAWCGL